MSNLLGPPDLTRFVYYLIGALGFGKVKEVLALDVCFPSILLIVRKTPFKVVDVCAARAHTHGMDVYYKQGLILILSRAIILGPRWTC